MAVISRLQHELLEEERTRLDAGSPQQAVGGQAQEARGMRHGAPPRTANAPAGRPPARPSSRPAGTRKGTAMDALQIFGAMAGGS